MASNFIIVTDEELDWIETCYYMINVLSSTLRE